MRILWSSVSPFVGSGYGMQTAVATRRLQSQGHNIAILCYFGLHGSATTWGDIPLYPNDPADYGVIQARMMYEHHKADMLITLVDVWVLRGMDATLKWFPWMPIDHDPVPPLVLETVKKHPGIVKPITMTKFGYNQLAKNGIDSYYIPHSVNTGLFKPDDEVRKTMRDRYQWDKKFIVGTVATNNGERKNWRASLKGIKILNERHPGEIIYYMHTNVHDKEGINLDALINEYGMKSFCRVPDATEMTIGIPQIDMARMYNVLDVFLLPSKGEGFGIPIIEAQSSGVPVITTKCTGHEELLGGGWYIKDTLQPEWTAQAGWQFNCDGEEVADRLEEAYRAWKDGTIVEQREKARAKAMEYDEEMLYSTYWPSVMADMEKKIKEPKNMEGVQTWRLAFLPQTIMPRKVLDLGSGLTCPYKKYLAQLGEYTAVDIRANDKTPDIKPYDAHHLPFPNKSFGFVWCSEMLEHCEHPEEVVSEAKRVGNHGVILFSTPQTPSFSIDPEHRVVNPNKVRYSTMQTGDGVIVW
jgi:glycosyltransferase involved in cell wall biosynthesis